LPRGALQADTTLSTQKGAVFMTLLADQIDGVIGVDTLTIAAVTPVGGLLGQLAVHADGAGYQRLLDFARAQVPGRRCFAVEGAGSYGAGLARMLAERGEWVVEVDRPSRPARRGGKTDALDAIRAAREALGQERLAAPRRRGDRGGPAGAAGHPPGRGDRPDVCHQPAQALIVGAPEELRAELRDRGTNGQVGDCAALRERPAKTLEHRMIVRVLSSTARRIQLLAAEAAELEDEIGRLVAAVAPWLLELPGILTRVTGLAGRGGGGSNCGVGAL
jgi:transposase